jgi:2-polyprenyl-3-methyl-5-hydroxy-6-metoxy-1,4-benzoquinol methylase
LKALSFEAFDSVYQDSVRAVMDEWNSETQFELARHCHAWGPGLFDFRDYLQVSSLRFYKAYSAIAEGGMQQRICDVGGFWGVFPMTLKAIGFDVTMTESLQYYGNSFKRLFERIAASGVRIFDYDPFQPGASLGERFDVVTVMAVLEHYPHSLKCFMENISSLLKPLGKLYLEVPNIAYWPKRVGLMFGQTPQSQLADIYRSEVPFIGHHHEFTISELRTLAALSELRILSESFYNYSNGNRSRWRSLIRHPIQTLAFSLLKDSRECMAILCQANNQEK